MSLNYFKIKIFKNQNFIQTVKEETSKKERLVLQTDRSQVFGKTWFVHKGEHIKTWHAKTRGGKKQRLKEKYEHTDSKIERAK